LTYARRRDDYLALFAPRDVIELPADEIFDVNGWDLAKALRLLLKGNGRDRVAHLAIRLRRRRDLLVAERQRRGRFRKEYTGKTLKENLAEG
jgi:RNA repair pathway DNA polymerase beta family